MDFRGSDRGILSLPPGTWTIVRVIAFTIAVSFAIAISALLLYGVLWLLEPLSISTWYSSWIALAVFAAVIAAAAYLLVALDDSDSATHRDAPSDADRSDEE